ncbi:TIGR00269 family protein [Candidatus Woesearchaeota archaeon]|jgi:tRNA-5-methyluridine54 2-sulfurtransferase|nr:TIGR00269 family protein [Candidatus Woesearchaeota archaeon]MBT5272331.1 TIGR00269 family protein [Candidatus Woesearchaeota archaeon]MBT6040660.1 TIGR00269 family protein [Candidatus Woesearchaeota archaeon]MBT6336603.1 TIGR00269 family protein [Candidatus Woesearchaeota archaeon]MBT7927493.1 TIGR00269 family protein [Candidatus Woesearchaeota archaeon]
MNKEDKAFIRKFEAKVAKTIKKYKLANKKDKVIVACSGGKDSTVTLYLMHKLGYKVEGLNIDLYIGKWSDKSLKCIKEMCKKLKVKLHIASMRDIFGCSICYIRSGIQAKIKIHNCAICGVIKRWLLNKEARRLKGNVIATGHNLDDQVETLVMNMIKGSPKLSLGQAPKTGIIKDKKFVQRIKPLYFCTNDEVRKYSKLMGFSVVSEPCPCSLNATRRKIRNQITKLEKEYKDLKLNMIKSFLAELPKMVKGAKKEKLTYCKICSEPARKDICKTCELIGILKK